MMSVIDWFEIPTTNLDRAAKFYETVLDVRLRHETFGGVPQAMLLGEKGAPGGALIPSAPDSWCFVITGRRGG